MYGNESDYFLMLLRPYLTSTITTTCCLTTCPLQVHSVHSMSVTLSQPSKLTSSIFLDALEDWQHPPDSQCGRKFSNKPVALNFLKCPKSLRDKRASELRRCMKALLYEKELENNSSCLGFQNYLKVTSVF